MLTYCNEILTMLCDNSRRIFVVLIVRLFLIYFHDFLTEHSFIVVARQSCVIK